MQIFAPHAFILSSSHNCKMVVLYRFFKESSEEEREHAEKLMEYQVTDGSFECLMNFILFVLYANYFYEQNKRGGKVKLHNIQAPPAEFDHVDKGDALYGKFSFHFLILWLICLDNDRPDLASTC